MTPTTGHSSRNDGPSSIAGAVGRCASARPVEALRGLSPLAVGAGWRSDRPLSLLHSGRLAPDRSRWSILTAPSRRVALDGPDPVAAMQELLDSTRCRPEAPTDLPFSSGWIVRLGYELGRLLEPAASSGPDERPRPDGAAWPPIELARCDAALLHDAADETWWVSGAEEHAEALLACAVHSRADAATAEVDSWRLSPWESISDADAFRAGVARTVAYIRAGDVFQANIARLLVATLDGDRRRFALDALQQAAPWYGALLEMDADRMIVSLSPELFLEGDLDEGTVLARPIKGTRPAACDPEELRRSEKDTAELTMIIDLMRNDLGRVCRTGSVAVSEPRHVETHPTVHHGVAGVRGRLRPDVDVAALVRATFPPGSVTGAPKIRAMQIIQSLEHAPRGPYCGAIGYVADHGRFALNVAIRTLTLAREGEAGRHRATYGVGCGIVADSDPHAEFLESEDKAAVVRGLVEGAAPRHPPGHAATRRRGP